jgi:hypothetical protein
MHSKFAAGHFHRHDVVRRSNGRALAAGLASFLFIFCALVGLSGFELYQALQPTRYPDAGPPAHELPSSSGSSEIRELQFRNDDKSSITPTFASAVELEEKANEALPQPVKAKKIDHPTTAVGSKRTRAVQRNQRNPGMAYAAQSSPGIYRRWGSYQSWSGYRQWDGFQAWGGYLAWGSYQTSHSQR